MAGAVGAGDKQGGATRVLYSPSYSERGVLLCAHRKLRAKDPFDFEVRCYFSTRSARFAGSVAMAAILTIGTMDLCICFTSCSRAVLPLA